uniref:NB-ARC domain-containing protein n=1 Tax=Cannabis sativa TaxID=3483 RepID=A0A803P6J2_CANSA
MSIRITHSKLPRTTRRTAALPQAGRGSWVEILEFHRGGNVTSKVKLHIKFFEKVKELNGRVDAICTEKDKFSFNMSNSTAPCSQQVGEPRLMTTSFIDVSEVYGRDREEQVLVDKLVGDHEGGIGSRDDKKNMTNNTLHIVGMGGIGKTTLAKLAYHAEKVKEHFNLRMWICVSEPFDEM